MKVDLLRAVSACNLVLPFLGCFWAGNLIANDFTDLAKKRQYADLQKLVGRQQEEESTMIDDDFTVSRSKVTLQEELEREDEGFTLLHIILNNAYEDLEKGETRFTEGHLECFKFVAGLGANTDAVAKGSVMLPGYMG